MEPCIEEEEESVCPESNVVESEDNAIPGEDSQPKQQQDIINGLQPSQSEDVPDIPVGPVGEAQNVNPEGSEDLATSPDKDTGDGCIKVSIMSMRNRESVGGSMDQAKPVLQEENEEHTEKYVLNRVENHTQGSKVECPGGTVGLKADSVNSETCLENHSSPVLDLADTKDDKSNKVKILSPQSSYTSKESGIQIDQELNEELVSKDIVDEGPLQNVGEQEEDASLSQGIKVQVSQIKNNENDENPKYMHWFVDFDDVAVADLLTSGEQGIIGECMTTILRDFHSSVKKPRFEYKSGAKFQTSLKKRMPKKAIKPCKGKEKGPCFEIANPQNHQEEMSFKKFPNRKLNSTGFRTLRQEPVKCTCRDNKENMSDLFVQGTSFPLYNLVNQAVEQFKFQYL